jgi:hypothetical protein
VGPKSGAFGVEGVELAKNFFEGPFARGFFTMENAAAIVLFAEVGLDGLVVAIRDADELWREAIAKAFEFVQFSFEGLGLARCVPFAKDGLEGNIGAERHFIGAGADLDGGTESFVKFLPAFVDGPVLLDFALGEVDEVEGPPFLYFEGALKGEGIKKGKLPIVVLGKFFEHGAQGSLAVGAARVAGGSATGATFESEQFDDEELRAAAKDLEGFSMEEGVRRPAQIFEGEHWMGAQDVAGGLKRVLQGAVGAGEGEHEAIDGFARQWQDNLHFVGSKKLLGESFDEPAWNFSGARAGVAIGKFEQKDLGDGADIVATRHEVRKFDKIFPAIAKAFGIDDGCGVGSGGLKKGEMNAAAPGSGVGEFAIEEEFDAFGGNSEEVGIQHDEGFVGAESGGSFGGASGAGVVHKELAGEAADEGGLGARGRRSEQKETKKTKQGERINSRRGPVFAGRSVSPHPRPLPRGEGEVVDGLAKPFGGCDRRWWKKAKRGRRCALRPRSIGFS